jgi:hypothetical protein
MTLMNPANPTMGRMIGRGAAEGGLYGAAYGFGSGEGTRDRLENAAYGGTLGAVTGGVAGAVGAKLAKTRGPSTADLKAQAGKAYQEAESAGVIIRGDSLKNMTNDIQIKLADEGIDHVLHPRALRVLQGMQEAADNNVTFKGAEILRRRIGDLISEGTRSEKRMGYIMRDALDHYISNLKPGDVLTGDTKAASNAIVSARDLWKRNVKTSTIEHLVERARDRSSQFSGSGYENALRTEFRQLARNDKRMAQFNDAERAAIRKVANGGAVGNLLRYLGKWAPTGVVSQAATGGIGYAVGGPVGAVALPAVGFGARQGATALTARNARMAADLMRTGGRTLPPTPLTPQQLSILRNSTIAAGQQGPRINTVRKASIPPHE